MPQAHLSLGSVLLACCLAAILILLSLAGVLAAPVPQGLAGPVHAGPRVALASVTASGDQAVTPTATATATATATPTATHTPTATATPTASPVPSAAPTQLPTWTPLPTRTPVPTSAYSTRLPATDVFIVATDPATPTPVGTEAFVPASPLATIPPAVPTAATSQAFPVASPVATFATFATPAVLPPAVAPTASPALTAEPDVAADAAVDAMTVTPTSSPLPPASPTATGTEPPRKRPTAPRTPSAPILAGVGGSTQDPASDPPAGPLWLLALGAILLSAAGAVALATVRMWRMPRS